MFNAYKFIGFLLIPIIKLNVYLRLLANKEDKERYYERYGISNLKRPTGNLIWIHASSIGEFKSVSSVINKLFPVHAGPSVRSPFSGSISSKFHKI